MAKNCLGGVRKSAVASQPCPSGHITADIKGNQRFPKIALSPTSFIPQPPGTMPLIKYKKKNLGPR